MLLCAGVKTMPVMCCQWEGLVEPTMKRLSRQLPKGLATHLKHHRQCSSAASGKVATSCAVQDVEPLAVAIRSTHQVDSSGMVAEFYASASAALHSLVPQEAIVQRSTLPTPRAGPAALTVADFQRLVRDLNAQQRQCQQLPDQVTMSAWPAQCRAVLGREAAASGMKHGQCACHAAPLPCWSCHMHC